MKLLVGLGNPGIEYQFTPHNLGFLAIDRLAEKYGARVNYHEALSLTGRARVEGVEVILAKPQTFVNASGMALRELLAKYDVGVEDLIVVADEVSLPWGMIRIREHGSAGGHNGFASVIGALGRDDFIRIRLGIQPDHPVADLAAYVLAPMRKAQLVVADEMLEQAAESVRVVLTEGVKPAMNRFNRRVRPPAV